MLLPLSVLLEGAPVPKLMHVILSGYYSQLQMAGISPQQRPGNFGCDFVPASGLTVGLTLAHYCQNLRRLCQNLSKDFTVWIQIWVPAAQCAMDPHGVHWREGWNYATSFQVRQRHVRWIFSKAENEGSDRNFWDSLWFPSKDRSSPSWLKVSTVGDEAIVKTRQGGQGHRIESQPDEGSSTKWYFKLNVIWMYIVRIPRRSVKLAQWYCIVDWRCMP